jgi:hypothetical protein
MSYFARRALLRDIAYVSAIYPCYRLVRSMVPDLGSARAQAQGTPKRVVFIVTPHGYSSEFKCENSSNGIVLDPMIEAFSSFKEDVTVVSGIDNAAQSNHGAIQAVLTGARMWENAFAGGRSIDQVLGTSPMAAGTPYGSLVLGVRAGANFEGGSEAHKYLSFLGPGNPVEPYNDPMANRDTLFGTGQNTSNDPQSSVNSKALLLRSSVKLFEERVKVLPTDVRLRLQEHVDSLMQIENRIEAVTRTTCERPDFDSSVENAPLEARGRPYMTSTNKIHAAAHVYTPAVADAQIDLIAESLFCDLTRVVTLQMAHEASDQSFPFLAHRGVPATRHHDTLQHDDGLRGRTGPVAQIGMWHASLVERLVLKLKSMQLPDGQSLMDNTLIVWGGSMGRRGSSHSSKDVPWMLVGGKWFVQSNRVIDSFEGRSNNDLLAAIGQGFGLQSDRFGDPNYSLGALNLRS